MPFDWEEFSRQFQYGMNDVGRSLVSYFNQQNAFEQEEKMLGLRAEQEKLAQDRLFGLDSARAEKANERAVALARLEHDLKVSEGAHAMMVDNQHRALLYSQALMRIQARDLGQNPETATFASVAGSPTPRPGSTMADGTPGIGIGLGSGMLASAANAVGAQIAVWREEAIKSLLTGDPLSPEQEATLKDLGPEVNTAIITAKQDVEKRKLDIDQARQTIRYQQFLMDSRNKPTPENILFAQQMRTNAATKITEMLATPQLMAAAAKARAYGLNPITMEPDDPRGDPAMAKKFFEHDPDSYTLLQFSVPMLRIHRQAMKDAEAFLKATTWESGRGFLKPDTEFYGNSGAGLAEAQKAAEDKNNINYPSSPKNAAPGGSGRVGTRSDFLKKGAAGLIAKGTGAVVGGFERGILGKESGHIRPKKEAEDVKKFGLPQGSKIYYADNEDSAKDVIEIIQSGNYVMRSDGTIAKVEKDRWGNMNVVWSYAPGASPAEKQKEEIKKKYPWAR